MLFQKQNVGIIENLNVSHTRANLYYCFKCDGYYNWRCWLMKFTKFPVSPRAHGTNRLTKDIKYKIGRFICRSPCIGHEENETWKGNEKMSMIERHTYGNKFLESRNTCLRWIVNLIRRRSLIRSPYEGIFLTIIPLCNFLIHPFIKMCTVFLVMCLWSVHELWNTYYMGRITLFALKSSNEI